MQPAPILAKLGARGLMPDAGPPWELRQPSTGLAPRLAATAANWVPFDRSPVTFTMVTAQGVVQRPSAVRFAKVGDK